MDLSRYAALFLTESREQLAACGKALLDWERDPSATEPAVSLFRAMHTFKGMAAAMGYANLTELAHRTESVLDAIRSAPASGQEHFDLFFRIVDALEQSAEQAVEGQDGGLDFGTLLGELDQASAAAAPTGSWAIPARAEADAPAAKAGRRIRVTINPAAGMRGARAFIALRKAEALGAVSGLRPPPAVIEQDSFDGVFTFQLETAQTDAAVVEAIRSVGDVAAVEVGDPTPAASREGLDRGRHIRVDLDRLDAMMKQVGELIVARGRLGELAEQLGNLELEAVSARIGRVSSEIHGEIVQARMTPVWQVFDRFPRVVRDLARQLGRRVRFEVEGEDIELDRSILDEVSEPLIHLLRNAVDHGIEAPEDRVRQGKSAEGQVRLEAVRDRGGVAIRVHDDGAGIDREKVLAKAIREKVLPKGTPPLTDDDLLRLLSRPGFSTAKRVTDVSGRGMGMDAVVARVRSLGGALELRTAPGQGTTFSLRLPLTLAIVRALLARVGEERYAIPTAGVAETVEFSSSKVSRVDGEERFTLRDEVLPTVRLRERLGIGGMRPAGRIPAVIIEVGDRRSALVVDALVGQQEIVVEPFEAPRGMVPVFSGATILGDGIPTLILDPAALV
jgi:two-component system, chemotaxis family, sensor kinase CheA